MPADLNAPSGERRARPKGVIFDIGRVIVALNLNRAFAPIAAGDTRSRQFRSAPFSRGRLEDDLRGRALA